MNLIPQAYAMHAALVLCVIGLTAAMFGIVTIIDTRRGKASCGDACMAFGLMCCVGAAMLVGWQDVVVPLLTGLALVRMTLAIAAAVGRSRNPPETEVTEATTPAAVEASDIVPLETTGPADVVNEDDEDADEVTVRFETPIDEDDLFARPDRPRAAMEAIVRQLGKGSQVVAIRARKG